MRRNVVAQGISDMILVITRMQNSNLDHPQAANLLFAPHKAIEAALAIMLPVRTK